MRHIWMIPCFIGIRILLFFVCIAFFISESDYELWMLMEDHRWRSIKAHYIEFIN